MQCGIKERVMRSMRTVAVRCFKCRKEGHKCRECPLWKKKVKRVVRPAEGKAHQQRERRLACLKKGKAQELLRL